MTEIVPVNPTKLARRKKKIKQTPTNQRRVLFAYYLAMGYTAYDAYLSAGFGKVSARSTHEELQLLRRKALDLSRDPRTETLVKACGENALALIQHALPMMTIGALRIAFTSKNEQTRLKAIFGLMDRGGLPVTNVSINGKLADFSSMSEQELQDAMMTQLKLPAQQVPQQLQAEMTEELEKEADPVSRDGHEPVNMEDLLK